MRRARTLQLFITPRQAPGERPASVPAMPPPAPADHTAVSRTMVLRQAAELHRDGVLSDDDFAALERRLRGG